LALKVQQQGVSPAAFTYCKRCFFVSLISTHADRQQGVDITGPQKDRDDYCLEPGNDDYCYNACAIPYGADFTLVNNYKNPGEDEIHYDPWFDEKKKTFKHITKSVLGKEPETTNLPSQYGIFQRGARFACRTIILTRETGKYPSPGHKTYVGDMAARPLTGKWQLDNLETEFTGAPWFGPALQVVVGQPSPRKDDEQKDGKNLMYDNYPGYSDGSDSDDEDNDSMDTSAKMKRSFDPAGARWNESSNVSPVKHTAYHDTAQLSRRGIRPGQYMTISLLCRQ
jgi:hypothetical protein